MDRLRGLLLTAAVVAAAVTALPLVAAAPAASAGQGAPAARAVAAVTGDRPDAHRAIPADFGAVMGYRPVRRQGSLVDPLGDCSTFLPLPADFEQACLEHDLGYDLLRYAVRTGEPLGGRARTAVDARMAEQIRSVCAERRREPVSRFRCFLTAEVAATGVRLNTVRQRFGAPEETPASIAVSVGAGASGLSVLALLVAPGVRRRTRTVPVRPPAATGSLLGTAAVLLSLLPSLLPRPASVQGLLTGLLLVVALGTHRLTGRLTRRLKGGVRPAGPAVRWCVLTAGAALVLVAGVVAGRSADAYRHDLGLAEAGSGYWLAAGAVAVMVVTAAHGLRALLRAVTRRLHRPRTQLACVATVVVLALAGPAVADAGWRALVSTRDVPFVLTRESPVPGSVRSYVGLDQAPTAAQRADLAVQQLVARGGFEKSAVVLALPTGTGWVNPFAVRGIERALDGDVATVALQAGRAPSWVEMLFRRDEQLDSARALHRAVLARLAAVPPTERPAVYLYGESLGALVGQALAESTPAGGSALCGVVWAGVPGGGSLGTPGEVLHRNPDDPVVYWEPSVVWDRPEDWPLSWWLPGISYLTTTLDLVTSLDTPHGHGHRYGPERDWSLPDCQ